MLKKVFLPLAILFFCQSAFSQLYNPSINVQHYEFNIHLSDYNDSIIGRAVITVRFTEKSNSVNFDLANVNDTGRGMQVTGVKENGQNISFTHQHNVINISLNKEAAAGEIRNFEISYKGVPLDGLIFSRNKFKHRTIFADNWPNRAHNWIPCKDHLSDKAAVDFIVTAPDHFQVISNGVKTEETNLTDHLRLTHWKEETPLPTKIMVIGVADFAVDYPGEINGVPVSSWIFPEQKEKGFYDYAQALDILPFFMKNVGPYSYKKLANVQSKTIFGGMENAGAIFYSENSVAGTRKTEELLAHEIAHQWFGDGATETDWPHLWLSEGFATEMTNLYLESKYGKDTLTKRLLKDRREIIRFTKTQKIPVVDTVPNKNIMRLLNTNAYEKGGWILQMLRNQLGDSVFWRSIRLYYATYRGKNASTRDLQKIFEQVSGKSLQTFFTQWLYTAENPTLQIGWQYDEKSKLVTITVTQQTDKIFVLPLDIQITGVDGNTMIKSIDLSKKTAAFTVPFKNKPSKMEADPNCKLLFEGTVKKN